MNLIEMQCRLMKRDEMRYRWQKAKERAIRQVVWHLPRSVVYWAAIRVGANATTGEYSNQVVPDLLFSDALKRWEK